MQILNQTTNLLAKRIEQLHHFVNDGSVMSGAKANDWQELAESMLARAPIDFLTRSSAPLLASIIKNSLVAISRFENEKPAVLVDAHQYDDSEERISMTGFHVIMKDRPFIIDSLAEALTQEGLQPSVILHPLIPLGGETLSLTFVEVDRIDDPSKLERIKATLTLVMHEVILATEDFLSIRELVEAAAARVFTRDTADSDTKHSGITSPAEISSFLTWLADEGLVFLGTQSYIKGTTAPVDPKGILKDPTCIDELSGIDQEAETFLQGELPLLIGKFPVRSRVHRRNFLDTILVKTAADEALLIVGMLTSKALAQEAASVPIVRRKLREILQIEDLPANSHAYKEVVSLLNHMPKAELLEGSVESILSDIRLMQGVNVRGSTEVHIRPFSSGRFTAITVALPRKRASSEIMAQLAELFEQRLNCKPGSATFLLTFIEGATAAGFFLLPAAISVSPEALSAEVEELVTSWTDKLRRALIAKYPKSAGLKLAASFESHFHEEYQTHASVEDAVQDIEHFRNLQDGLEASLSWRGTELPNTHELRIYRNSGAFTLSGLVPVLENVGFEVISENLTKFRPQGSFAPRLYKILLTPTKEIPSGTLDNPQEFLAGLREILLRHAENDILNSLLLSARLSLREISLLRTYCRYLFQIKVAPSFSAIAQALVSNPEQGALLVELFKKRFDPKLPESRSAAFEEAEQRFLDSLRGVQSISEDRILHLFLKAIHATLRTNYFRQNTAGQLALKISPKEIPGSPKPVPYREIFVSGPEVEGLHLRFGRIARGGLRWSDRPDDYRTEVLGLVKTQHVKNTIIVPVGAKGGFIVKTGKGKPTSDEVTRSYQLFIRSLLEVTDNRVGTEIHHPEDVVCHDDLDPYFVVAADKGTAQFSDVANAIAEKEFNFWLGDAFASGGSQGYSHKKYGITARGAWEAALVHFRELGIDPHKEPFTVVGIGDMSGDVFGNGLIISDKAKLLAAFDHRHIFIDPNPDPTRSFNERKRLFDLPRSSWMDYDHSLLSPGGGIYSREEKSIKLSNEAKRALDVAADEISASDLIKAILRAPVDLLWNGGIGTYVKASTEEHTHAADRTNDDVRVDASEIRARILGEGGNLGFTQKGRIELCERGGKLNTDAIDNSGGVDLSDHEVNLKILLGLAIARGSLLPADRSALLLRNAEAICNSVLERNRAQSTALSLITKKSSERLPHVASFFRKLEKRGLLDRRVETLPDDEEIQRRIKDKRGLTRPETAVLLAYSKMYLAEILLGSDIPEEPALEKRLLGYFPEETRVKFRGEILEHPLRREIISTQLANLLAERFGPIFVYRLTGELGISELQVIQAAIASWEILKGDEIIHELEALETEQTIGSVHHAMLRLQAALYGMTRLLAKRWRPEWTIRGLYERYQAPIDSLLTILSEIAPTTEQERHAILSRDLAGNGFPESLIRRVAGFDYSQALLEISELSLSLNQPLAEMARDYSLVGERLQISEILDRASELRPGDPWERAARRATVSDIRESIGAVCEGVLRDPSRKARISEFLSSNQETLVLIRDWLQEFSKRPITLGALVVIDGYLQGLAGSSRNQG